MLLNKKKITPAPGCALLSRHVRLLLVFSSFWLLFAACTLQHAVYTPAPESGIRHPFPAIRFIVLADPHYFAPELGIGEPAFKNYIKQEPKLLAYSAEILTTLINNVKKEQADFVLICGDLTKDGEKVSHEQVIQLLQALEAQNKPVYVIPGNHDVGNRHAYRYRGSHTEPVASITPVEFATLYADFGFQEALYRDPASLSYIAEPVPGLWLFALDSCGNDPQLTAKTAHTEGSFSPATVLWIKEMLVLAQKSGKAVIGSEHHALLEHFPGQKKYLKEYIIDDNEPLARLFAAFNMPLIFTGHYHAQDAILKTWQEKGRETFLYEVMTGSTVNYPCPYRLIQITNEQQVVIRTKQIGSLPSYPHNFLNYVYKFQYLHILRYLYNNLVKYKIDKRSAYRLAQQLAKIAMDNFRGDEQPNKPILTYQGLSLWARLAASTQMGLFRAMSTDPSPPDNNLIIDLRSQVLTK